MEDKLDKKSSTEKVNLDEKNKVLQKVDSPHTIKNNDRDIVLWTKIKKGETEALGDLYDLYIDILFPYGISLSSNRVLVMDSIHDLFIDLYKYRKKLAHEPQVKYYLLKSLKRNIYKKDIKKETASNKLDEGNYLFPDLFEYSVEKKLIDFENDIDKKRQVNKALAGLSNKQKIAIRLKFYENRSYEEIAELLDVTIETSRTIIYRAMVALRQILTK